MINLMSWKVLISAALMVSCKDYFFFCCPPRAHYKLKVNRSCTSLISLSNITSYNSSNCDFYSYYSKNYSLCFEVSIILEIIPALCAPSCIFTRTYGTSYWESWATPMVFKFDPSSLYLLFLHYNTVLFR